MLRGVRAVMTQPATACALSSHCRLPEACLCSLSTMQAAAMRGAAVVPAKAKAFTASRRQQRRAARRVSAVATLEPEAAVEPEAEPEVDSEALYRRFEELIDASMLSFHTGDRVGRAWLAGGGPCKGRRHRRRDRRGGSAACPHPCPAAHIAGARHRGARGPARRARGHWRQVDGVLPHV